MEPHAQGNTNKNFVQFVDSHFVLDAVPVREDQVSGPTSSRIQRVSDENFLEASLCQIEEDDFLSLAEVGFFSKKIRPK